MKTCAIDADSFIISDAAFIQFAFRICVGRRRGCCMVYRAYSNALIDSFIELMSQ